MPLLVVLPLRGDGRRTKRFESPESCTAAAVVESSDADSDVETEGFMFGRLLKRRPGESMRDAAFPCASAAGLPETGALLPFC